MTFFGCCGVCTENHCMLYIFGTLLSLILIMEIGAAVAALVLKDEAWTQILCTLVLKPGYYKCRVSYCTIDSAVFILEIQENAANKLKFLFVLATCLT